VTPGYKHSELGPIPVDWSIKRLSEIVIFLDGKRRPVKDADRAKMQGNIPYFGASGIVDFVNSYLFDEELILLAEDGENILSRHTAIAFQISGKAWVNNHAHVLKPLPSMVIGYLANFLESQDYARHNSGTAQPKLNKKTCLGLPIAVPSTRTEQEAIAEALSDTDALIKSLEDLLTKKRQIKAGTMQELLTGKRRLLGFGEQKPRYKRTNIGIVPTDWTETSLESIAAFITKGSTPTTYGFAWKREGVMFLRSECVSEHGLDLSQSMFISENAHHMLKRSEARGGDLLLTITGNVGRIVKLHQDFGHANINQHIARIRIINNQVVSDFVFHYMSQLIVRNFYNLITTGQAYPQLSLKQVRETEIPLPSFREQMAISAVLSEMDAELSSLESQLRKVGQVKQGMMKELLTGRIRLV
jgi:type I restriction enzyme, S subunit